MASNILAYQPDGAADLADFYLLDLVDDRQHCGRRAARAARLHERGAGIKFVGVENFYQNLAAVGGFQNHSLLLWLTCFENVHLAVERVFGARETSARLRERTGAGRFDGGGVEAAT